jgi:uncharacterized protein (TIGR04255 family)
MERRQYRNPPIEEALCELRFEPGAEWDVAVIGRFRERIKALYAGKPREQQLMEAGFQWGPQRTDSFMSLRQGLARVQFPTDDGRRLVAVGHDVMSVHVLRPYPGWDEDFRPRIAEVLAAYTAITAPTGVQHISLRYINRVVIQQASIMLDDYFTAPPPIPASFPQISPAIFSRIESSYADEPIRLAYTFANAQALEGQSAFLLDLDLRREWQEEPLPLGAVMEAVETLRQHERSAFEALITNKAREVFDAA